MDELFNAMSIAISVNQLREIETQVIALKKKLDKVEKQLEKARTSSLQDGWQTSKHAKKSRKWDLLATEKHNIKMQIEELEIKSRQITTEND